MLSYSETGLMGLGKEECRNQVPFPPLLRIHDSSLLMETLIISLKDQIHCWLERTNLRTTSDSNHVFKHKTRNHQETFYYSVACRLLLPTERKLYDPLQVSQFSVTVGLFVVSEISWQYVFICLSQGFG